MYSKNPRAILSPLLYNHYVVGRGVETLGVGFLNSYVGEIGGITT
jgi:hypothetical protein